jgi:type VI protein secretion system component VasK
MARFPRHVVSCWGLLGPPRTLSLGPGWLLLSVIFVLMIPIVITNSRGYFKITRMLTFAALALITVAMIASLIFLVQGIPSHREMPKTLLRSALALWITNILVFALWYWKARRWRPHRPRSFSLQDCQRVSLPAAFERSRALRRLVTTVSRLSVRCLQHEHRFFANRHCRTLSMG